MLSPTTNSSHPTFLLTRYLQRSTKSSALIIQLLASKIVKLESRSPQYIPYIYSLLGSFCFSYMALIIKRLEYFPTSLMVLFRSVVLLLLNHLIMSTYGMPFYSKNPSTNRKLIIRGILSAIGLSALFDGIQLLPLNESIVLTFTSPVISAVLARFILHERFDKLQFATLILAILGITLILEPANFITNVKPTQDTENRMIGGALCLVSALIASFIQVCYGNLSLEISNFTILQYNGFFGIIWGSVSMLKEGVQYVDYTNWNDYLYLTMIGVSGLVGLLCYVRALMFGINAKVAITCYTQILICEIFGVWYLNEIPRVATLVGSVMICGSVVGVLEDEHDGEGTECRRRVQSFAK